MRCWGGVRFVCQGSCAWGDGVYDGGMINRTFLGRIVSLGGFLAFVGYMLWFQYVAVGTLSTSEYNSGAALLVFIICIGLVIQPHLGRAMDEAPPPVEHHNRWAAGFCFGLSGVAGVAALITLFSAGVTSVLLGPLLSIFIFALFAGILVLKYRFPRKRNK